MGNSTILYYWDSHHSFEESPLACPELIVLAEKNNHTLLCALFTTYNPAGAVSVATEEHTKPFP